MRNTGSIGAFVLTLWLLNSSPAYSQASYDISIVLPGNIEKVKNAPDLYTALKTLQPCTDHSFVIEGAPLKLASPRPLASKLKIDPKNPTRFVDLMQQVASIYDYTVTEQDHTYIFTKNYTSPEDYPDVGGEELKLFLKNVAVIAKRYWPNHKFSSTVDSQFLSLAGSLTDDERNKLSYSGKEIRNKEAENLPIIGKLFKPTDPNNVIYINSVEEYEQAQSGMIRYSHLSPAKQRLFQSILFTETVEKPYKGVGEGIAVIQQLDTAKVNFRWITHGEIQAFTCCRTIPSGRTYTTTWPSLMALTLRSTSPSLQLPTDRDPERPKPEDYDAAGKPLPRPIETTGTITLAELCSQLNSSLKRERFTVNPILSSKRIILMDSGKTSPEAILQAVSRIYNLPLEESEDKLNLTIPTVKPSKTWEEATRQVAHLFPGPLLRLCQTAQEQIGSEEEKKLRQIFRDINFPNAEKAPISRDTAYDVLTGVHRLHQSMVHRLRVLLEPRTKAAKDQVLPWSELREEEKDWTKFTLSGAAISDAYKLTPMGLPLFLKEPQDCVVSASLSESQGRRYFKIAMRTPDGSSGATGIAVISEPR